MRKPYKIHTENIENGKKEGFCIQEWQDGTILKGNFKNNKLEGMAAVITKDGKTFQG